MIEKRSTGNKKIKYRARVRNPRDFVKKWRLGSWRINNADASKDEMRLFAELKVDLLREGIDRQVMANNGAEARVGLTLSELRVVFEQSYCPEYQQPRTTETDRIHFYNRIAPYLGAYDIAQITPVMINRMLRSNHSGEPSHGVNTGMGPLGTQTTNRLATILNVMYRWAIDEEFIESSPLAGVTKVRKKKIEKCRKELRYLRREGIDRLLSYCKNQDPWLFPLVYALVSTGMRWQELKALRRKHLSDNGAGLVLCISDGFEKPSQGRCAAIKPCKNYESRIIPLARNQQAFFRHMAVGKNAEEFLFFSSLIDGQHETKLKKHLVEAVAACGLGYVSIHDLRHTYAVLELEAGTPIKTISAMLGHKTIAVTEKYYLEVTSKLLEESRNNLDFDFTPLALVGE